MPSIPRRAWNTYIEKLAKVNKAAADRMSEWIQMNGVSDMDACIEYAYSLSTAYGEAAATLACQMYDYTAKLQRANVPPAMPAETANYYEVSSACVAIEDQMNDSVIPSAVARYVKRAAADTMLKNAERDGAEFAWIPNGDTCAFCIMLASNGWQRVSKKTLKKGHAEHIHNNCNCEYSVRFDSSGVNGYDPSEYKRTYDDASTEGAGEKYIGADGKEHVRTQWQARLNSMRRETYAKTKQDD